MGRKTTLCTYFLPSCSICRRGREEKNEWPLCVCVWSERTNNVEALSCHEAVNVLLPRELARLFLPLSGSGALCCGGHFSPLMRSS